MLYGLYISAAGMQVNQLRMGVQTNNLANVNTPGFKLDRLVVEPRPRATDPAGRIGRSEALAGLGGGLWARRTVTQFTAGPLEATGQMLDIALDTGARADGFLAVQGPDGEAGWTRDGRLAVDESGRLVTQSGRHPLLSDAGRTIQVDLTAGRVTIDAAGRIRQGNTEIARLGLGTFQSPDRLGKRGGGLYAAGEGETPQPFRGQVLQGHVEGSAVVPTSMLAELIQTQRAYEANANMIRFQDQTLGRAVNDIAKI